MRIFADANFDFLGRRRTAFLVSGIAIAVSLIAMIGFQLAGRSWVNYGVDFTGGTLLQLETPPGTTAAQLREVVEPLSPGASITQFGADNEYLIRLADFGGEGAQDATMADQIVAAVQAALGADGVQVVRTENVAAKVGAELQQKAAMAILFSLGLTLIYLAFRFEWRSGVASVITTFHDVVLTLGLLSLLRLEVSLATVAAVLTIIGYSLNDTIVIFDRVRENLKKLGRRETLPAILNRSINETLPRTTMTSVTTLVALLALFLFGGAVIRDFALILIFGVVIGTASSIFVAAPVLLLIHERWPRKQKKGGSGGGGTRKRPARAQAAV